MSSIIEQNAELQRTVDLLAQRILGEIEHRGDMATVRRIAAFGGPITQVAETGGGYREMFEAVRGRLEEIEWGLELRLARAGFGPEERLALLPQIQSRMLGKMETMGLLRGAQRNLPGGQEE